MEDTASIPLCTYPSYSSSKASETKCITQLPYSSPSSQPCQPITGPSPSKGLESSSVKSVFASGRSGKFSNGLSGSPMPSHSFATTDVKHAGCAVSAIDAANAPGFFAKEYFLASTQFQLPSITSAPASTIPFIPVSPGASAANASKKAIIGNPALSSLACEDMFVPLLDKSQPQASSNFQYQEKPKQSKCLLL